MISSSAKNILHKFNKEFFVSIQNNYHFENIMSKYRIHNSLCMNYNVDFDNKVDRTNFIRFIEPPEMQRSRNFHFLMNEYYEKNGSNLDESIKCYFRDVFDWIHMFYAMYLEHVEDPEYGDIYSKYMMNVSVKG